MRERCDGTLSRGTLCQNLIAHRNQLYTRPYAGRRDIVQIVMKKDRELPAMPRTPGLRPRRSDLIDVVGNRTRAEGFGEATRKMLLAFDAPFRIRHRGP